MKYSKAFLKAAKLIESGKEVLACYAILKAFKTSIKSTKQHFVTNNAASAINFLEQLFKPLDCNSVFWFGNIVEVENKNHRIMALLLMSEIFKDFERNLKWE